MRALQFGLVCMQMNVCGPGCTQRTAMGKHCCQLVKPQGGKRHMCFSMKVPTNCIWELLASCDVQGTKLAGKAQTELGTGSETGRKKSSRSPREGSPGSKQVTATSHCGPSAGLGLLASAAHRRVELTQSCLHNALQASARGEGAAATRAISLFCRPPRGGLGSPLLPPPAASLSIGWDQTLQGSRGLRPGPAGSALALSCRWCVPCVSSHMRCYVFGVKEQSRPCWQPGLLKWWLTSWSLCPDSKLEHMKWLCCSVGFWDKRALLQAYFSIYM